MSTKYAIIHTASARAVCIDEDDNIDLVEVAQATTRPTEEDANSLLTYIRLNRLADCKGLIVGPVEVPAPLTDTPQ
jgi:hypothetical protein